MRGVRGSVYVGSIVYLLSMHSPAWAQSPTGQWTSEGARAEIEIYAVARPGMM